MNPPRDAPPAWAERALEACLPSDALGRSIAGDLRHEYVDRSRHAGSTALAWYVGQILGVGGWYLLMRLCGRYRRPGTPRRHLFNRARITMNPIAHDVRLALRGLRRAPLFAVTAIATIGLGIGAVTSVYSVLHAVLFTPLNLPDAEQVVTVWGSDENYGRVPLPAPDFRAIRDQSTLIGGLAARWPQTQGIQVGETAEEVMTARVTDQYFHTLGLQPGLGRVFVEGDQNVAILSHGIWTRLFGADPDVLGRVISVGGNSVEVIGVLPAEFNPNLTTISRAREMNDVWLVLPESWLGSNDLVTAWIRAVGRLEPGATVAQAQEEINTIYSRMGETVPERADGSFRPTVHGARDDLVSGVRRLLYVMFAAVAFVLLIACFNVANLLLVRGQTRQHELTVRAALGAGRGQLVWQMFTETGVLAVLGGLTGVGLATVGIGALRALRPANLPRVDTVTLDGSVLVFTVASTAVAALLFGLIPVLRSTRIDPHHSLTQRSSSASRRQRTVSRALIVAEVALSLTLLVGSGLLLRTFSELRGIRPGFEPERLLTMSITSSGRHETGAEAVQFMNDLFEEIASAPGVQVAGSTHRLPLAGGIYGGPWATSAAAIEAGDNPEADFRFVSSGYFEAMGTKLLAGRAFEVHDGDDVAIVSARMAELAWPGENPVGKLLWTGELGRNGGATTVVGVVENVRHSDLARAAKETVYFADTETTLSPGAQRYVAVRSTSEAAGVAATVRSGLARLDPGATISRVRPMEDLVADALAPTRFALTLIVVFALVAIVLAGIGLYGVIAYNVSQRRREMGIRLALGARRADILRTVLGEGLALSGAGLVLGVVASLGLSSAMGALLYGVSTTDTLTFGVVALVLAVVCAAASYGPARHATAVDPTVALRQE